MLCNHLVKMLSSLVFNPVKYNNLRDLANSCGVVSVGRDPSSIINLSSQSFPTLVSRKHCSFEVQPDGHVHLINNSSTNGTYLARNGNAMQKLGDGTTLELLDGDILGFGGLETMDNAKNPFVFKYSTVGGVQGAGNDKASPSEPEKKVMPEAEKILGDVKDVLSSQFTCAICQDWILGCHTMSCSHMFCGACIAKWLNRKQACPTCRMPMSCVPVRCFQVDNAIEGLLAKGVHIMSPASNAARKRKRHQWDQNRARITIGWEKSYKDSRSKALKEAVKNNRFLEIQ